MFASKELLFMYFKKAKQNRKQQTLSQTIYIVYDTFNLFCAAFLQSVVCAILGDQNGAETQIKA